MSLRRKEERRQGARAAPARAASATRPARCSRRRRRRGARSCSSRSSASASLLLLGRAVYVQIIDAPFFLKQGEIRYGHTIELPASRGRIVDRNGLILAASMPAPSIWAIPKDLEGDARARARLATLLDMTSAALEARLADNPNFVWLRRQVDESVAKAVRDSRLKGIHEVREYKRKYPEGEAAAHVVGFTNVEDHGQEGVELAFQKRARRPRRHAPRHQGPARPRRRGRRRQRRRRSRARTSAWRSTRRCSSSPTSGSATRSPRTRRRPAASSSSTRRPARCWRSPTSRATRPPIASNLTGAQLRNRALTDTFEPGSTMKPFIAAGRSRPAASRRRP